MFVLNHHYVSKDAIYASKDSQLTRINLVISESSELELPGPIALSADADGGSDEKSPAGSSGLDPNVSERR